MLVARALGDPTRLRILRAIASRPELTCQELVERCAVSQATVSHHLKVLVDAGLVAVRKGGAFHYYRAVPGALDAHGAVIAGTLVRRDRAAARVAGRAATARKERAR